MAAVAAAICNSHWATSQMKVNNKQGTTTTTMRERQQQQQQEATVFYVGCCSIGQKVQSPSLLANSSPPRLAHCLRFASWDLRQLFCHVVDWGIGQSERGRSREREGEVREEYGEQSTELNSSTKCQLPKMVKHIFNKLLGVCLCRWSHRLSIPLSLCSPL